MLKRLWRKALQREVFRTIIVFAVALSLIGVLVLTVTEGDQARDLARLALHEAMLNRRELALEHPSDAQIRQEVDAAIARLSRRQRERLLRVLLSAVPPRTLAALIHAGSHAPRPRQMPGAFGPRTARPPLVPLNQLSPRPQPGSHGAPQPPSSSGGAAGGSPPRPQPQPQPLLPLPAVPPLPGLPPVSVPPLPAPSCRCRPS